VERLSANLLHSVIFWFQSLKGFQPKWNAAQQCDRVHHRGFNP
jgi:hypothetical protein